LRQRRYVLAGPETGVEHDDRLAAQPTETAASTTLRETAIEDIVADGNAEPGGERLECGDELGRLHLAPSYLDAETGHVAACEPVSKAREGEAAVEGGS